MADKVSSSYSYLQTSNNRFSGLASGMDIDSIVEKLMKAESVKMEKLQQQKQKYEWQRDAYREIDLKLETFYQDAFNQFGLQKNWLTRKTSVSDNNKVSVTAELSAAGNLYISSVSQLATAAVLKNENLVKLNNDTIANGSTKLSELGISGEGKFSLTVLQQDGSMKTTDISYSENTTIDDLIKSINSSGAGVTAMFYNGQMSITANATGSAKDGAIQVINDDEGLFTQLGFSQSSADGKNAVYTINSIEKESISNTIKEAGYTIALKQTFDEGSGTVSISSEVDTDAIYEKIKSFITMYNDLVDSLNKPLKEKQNLNYPPLTDAQKAEMTEDQIKKWEEMAKQGLLRNDSILSNVLSEMRNIIYTVNDNNKFKGLFNIGITTTSKYSDGGKIEIKDEQKLKDAIASDPESVVKLFTDIENGIIAKLRKATDSASKQIDKKAGKSTSGESTYSLGRTIRSLNDQIDNWKKRLKDIEERYYKQFTRMEEAINKANAQAGLFMPSF